MLKNRRTATITWLKWNNFGTFLQAYALQKTIIDLGYENHILSDECIPNPNISFIDSCKRFVRKIFPAKKSLDDTFFTSAMKEVDNAYQSFVTKNMIVDRSTAKQQSAANLLYDQFICGSDQIWSPALRKHLQGYYYADFFIHKKIAYAASFGVEKYPEHLKEEFRHLVSNFAALSCREVIGCKFVNEILNYEAANVVDPTLLLQEADWRKVAESPSMILEDKYILTYFLSPNQWYLDCARNYARQHKLKLVTFYLRPSSPNEADVTVCAGPGEFISYIDKAEIFFTDSFHGSIFATQMRTPFVGFQRFTDEKSGQNHRLIDLYNKMNILDRFITDATDSERIENLPMQNFEEMRNALQPEIQSSLEFLKKALEK